MRFFVFLLTCLFGVCVFCCIVFFYKKNVIVILCLFDVVFGVCFNCCFACPIVSMCFVFLIFLFVCFFFGGYWCFTSCLLAVVLFP